ncbi:class A sortase [Leuconostoc rapi]|uniref:class A sortase n=1 Tax=Leuconostoc rapi TaxID=1406906 RepID=UPI00195A2F3D|nr:class A sortase [Leuconostoc rapi]MBM7434935.1 sortase A [Leuconostoc rapi]
MLPFIFSVALSSQGKIPSQNGEQFLYLATLFCVTFMIYSLGELIIKSRRGKKSVAFYNATIVSCVVTILALVGVYLYQNNIANVKDTVLNHTQKYQRTKANKNSRQDNTSRRTIAKMVMRHAAKGLEKQGFVSIPSQNILLPIYNDAYSDKGLNAGADYANRSEVDPEGQQKPIMGQGNYGLAGHNFNDGHTGFSALQESANHDSPYLSQGRLKGSSWLNGQTVLLANQQGIYQYVISGQTTVPLTQISILNPQKNAQLTIISCLFPSTEYRIITHAKLHKIYTWSQAPAKYVSEFNLKIRDTNARANWWNPGVEEGANGDKGGTK